MLAVAESLYSIAPLFVAYDYCTNEHHRKYVQNHPTANRLPELTIIVNAA